MKRTLLVFALAIASALAAPLDPAALRERFGRTGEEVWRSALEPEKSNPRVSSFFNYALTLCETGLHPERLEKLFTLAAARQDLDPRSETYGSFRWSWNDREVTDRNAIEFCMQPAAIVWKKHRDALPPAARDKLRAILDPAVQASLTHQVAPSYTNIALMSAGNLIVLGEGLGREQAIGLIQHDAGQVVGFGQGFHPRSKSNQTHQPQRTQRNTEEPS
jgi:hypothetical protein